MAAKRTPGSRPGLIQCDNCGEQYSDTYRRCPFCDEYDEYEDEYEPLDRPASRGGGKRLVPSTRRGGGYSKTSPLKVISIIISLAVILTATWIVVTKIMPMIARGDIGTVDPNSDVSQGVSPDVDTSANVSGPDTAANDISLDPPDVSFSPDVSPSPDISPAIDDGGATGFSLNKSEFSFSNRYPEPVTLQAVFTPTGSTGSITWSSSDPDIVSVDENGTVSHGAKTGTATITAALANGVTQTCVVHNQVTGSTTSDTSGGAGSASVSYTINNPDFTLYRVGETYQLKVNGYTGNVRWSSSNTGIATVSNDGTCTAVGSGKGSCTVTGTLDNGSTVEAIVRINIS